MIKTILLLAVIGVLSFAYAEGPLNIHVVAHTHDDVGWLKTPDEYYYGANQSIQDAGVQYILDGVITALQMNPDRKFIYVEMGFFTRWWREQNDQVKQQVTDLVNSGQLEFINGGWTMHDEAAVHFEDMVSQMTLGHQFLFDTFGIIPKVGWQIDPFGHSSTSALLNVLTGFEALFFARMDYQDEANRIPQKAEEMIWYPSYSNTNYSLLTGMMHGGYCETGFMFEYGDDPVMDDPLLENYNLVAKADLLVNNAKNQAAALRHNDYMFKYGCDFLFGHGEIQWKNLEKLMDYINANQATYNVKMFYSTPSIYADAIKASGADLPSKTDDFFPYADGPHSYWTGYFVSRSTLKGFVRYSSNVLSVANHLVSASLIQDASMYATLSTAQAPNAVATHHDAVSGTEQQHVADDYALNLNKANNYAVDVLSELTEALLITEGTLGLTYCPLINETICEATRASGNPGDILPVILYNSLAIPRSEIVRLPMSTGNVAVTDAAGNTVPTQIGQFGEVYYVSFEATVPAVGFSTYVVQFTSGQPIESVTYVKPQVVEDDITISGNYISVTFDAQGNIQQITDKETGSVMSISQEYLYYVPNVGDSVNSQASGAYIFRPATDGQTPLPFATQAPTVIFNNGTLFSEVIRVFQPELAQVYRVYANERFVEVIDIVGPIDISSGGKEVITRYNTSLNTDQSWWTDSNGVEMMPRRLNYRPSWNYTITEPVSGNYVPIDSTIFVRDSSANQQFTILVDRSRGGASLANGQIETMLHRRLLVDDGRGVGEPLNETTVMSSTSWLVFSNDTSAVHRPLSKRLYHTLLPLFSNVSSLSDWKSMVAGPSTYSPINALPEGVQLLSFVPKSNGEYIMRLHHIYQADENVGPVSVDVNAIVAGHQLDAIRETQLTGVAVLAGDNVINYQKGDTIPASLPVTINPMEIRTFVVSFAINAARKVNIV